MAHLGFNYKTDSGPKNNVKNSQRRIVPDNK